MPHAISLEGRPRHVRFATATPAYLNPRWLRKQIPRAASCDVLKGSSCENAFQPFSLVIVDLPLVPDEPISEKLIAEHKESAVRVRQSIVEVQPYFRRRRISE